MLKHAWTLRLPILVNCGYQGCILVQRYSTLVFHSLQSAIHEWQWQKDGDVYIWTSFHSYRNHKIFCVIEDLNCNLKQSWTSRYVFTRNFRILSRFGLLLCTSGLRKTFLIGQIFIWLAESHDCWSPWSGNLGKLFPALQLWDKITYMTLGASVP